MAKKTKQPSPAPAAASKPYVAGATVTSAVLDVAGPPDFYRADIEFDGVDHAEASFEARVFLNNPTANQMTAMTDQTGFAGTFNIFGHGGCFGDVGHCDVRGPRRPYDPRPAHPLTPARKVVIATEPLRRALKKNNKVTVTVVPIVLSATEKCDLQKVLKYTNVSIVTYK
jgi:tyrosinase